MKHSVEYWQSRCRRLEQVVKSYKDLATHHIGANGRDSHVEILEAKITRLQIAHRDLAKHCGMTAHTYLQYLIDRDLIEEGL